MPRMHIEVTGSGAPLVLIHGWSLHGGVFEPLVRRLADRYQLHLVDLPGHGHSRDSAVPLQLRAVADDLIARTPPAVWVAWSLGGLFALEAAAQSDRVRGLAMIAATPRFVRSGDWPHAVEPAVFDQFGQDLRQDYAGTLDRFLALDTIGSQHAMAELRTLKDTLYARGEPAPQALQDGLSLLENTDLRAALPDLAMPSLWLSGRRDRLVPAAGMRQAAALAPHGRHHDIAGGGHAPFLGHADQVAAEIAGFVESPRIPSMGAT